MAGRIAEACGGSVAGKAIAVLGITFKPNTSDVRQSPSLAILPALIEQGAEVRAYDPAGMEEAGRILDGVIWCGSAYEAMAGADALVILTEWNEFRALDLDRVRSLLKTPLIVDLRNVYDPAAMGAAGFRYVSVGRPPVEPDPGERLPAQPGSRAARPAQR